jgi:hypothetical protein
LTVDGLAADVPLAVRDGKDLILFEDEPFQHERFPGESLSLRCRT